MHEIDESFAILRKDEDTGKLFWEINCLSNKDYTRLDDNENIILNPKTFQIGTVVSIKEPFVT